MAGGCVCYVDSEKSVDDGDYLVAAAIKMTKCAALFVKSLTSVAYTQRDNETKLATSLARRGHFIVFVSVHT